MLIVENGGTLAAVLSVAGMCWLCLRTMLTAERNRLAQPCASVRRRTTDRAPFNDLR